MDHDRTLRTFFSVAQRRGRTLTARQIRKSNRQGNAVQCPLLAISGHTEGSSRTSALPPKADIVGARTGGTQKADIECLLCPRKRTLARGPQMLAMAGRSSGAHPARDHVSKLPAPPFLALIATDHLRLPQAWIKRLPARIVLPPGERHHNRVAAIR